MPCGDSAACRSVIGAAARARETELPPARDEHCFIRAGKIRCDTWVFASQPTRQAAERRQDEPLSIARETGSRDEAPANMNSQFGVEMARNLRPHLALLALMAKDDPVDDQLVSNLAPPRTAGQPVVIARNPQQFCGHGLRGKSLGNRGYDPAGSIAVMETVAEAPDGPRAGFSGKRGEPVERVVAVVGRQRLAESGVPARLFEMQIGDDQRAVTRPEQRAVGQHAELLARKVEWRSRRHGSAMAAAHARRKRASRL